MSLQYSKHYNVRQTPQAEAIPGREVAMVQNSAGGFSFALDNWKRAQRFLILGSEGGSYYVDEKTLTRENAKVLEACINEDGTRLVNLITTISEEGRAPKNDPAIFALAMAAKLGDGATKQAAYAALPRVCRIGTHLQHWCAYVDAIGGWGSGTQKAVAKWFNASPLYRVVYQAVKYQSRDGWSMRDILRLAHVKPIDDDRNALFRWIVKGREKDLPPVENVPEPLRLIWAFERAKKETDPKELVRLITEFDLPREALPTEALNLPAVWDALLPHMGLTALIRNLATMTRVGLLAPMSNCLSFVVDRLLDGEQIKRGRVHPVQFLSALLTYKAGHGTRGSHTWTPVTQIIDALDEGFYKSFGLVEPTGKRHYVALDVSGSMSGGEIAGVSGLTPRVASSAMAMVRCRVEKAWIIKGFTAGSPDLRGHLYGRADAINQLSISPKMRLDDICKYTDGLDFGGTDCALPMLDALQRKIPVDVFEVYTDSETWAGEVHPIQALRQYRDQMGIPAKLVVVGMLSSGVSIADPDDAGMLDVTGFDTATPNLISDFARE